MLVLQLFCATLEIKSNAHFFFAFMILRQWTMLSCDGVSLLFSQACRIIDISLDAWTKDKYEKIRVESNYHRVWSNVHRFLYLRNKLKAKTKVMVSIIDQPGSHEEVEKFREARGPMVTTTRVGITKAAGLPLRFYLQGSSFVSVRAREGLRSN